MSDRRFSFHGQNAEAYNSREPEVLLAGAAGTGKSVVLLTKCLTILDKYPGCRGLFCRGTRASLTQSGLVTWEDDVLGKDHRLLTRNPIKRRVRQSYEFPNGSEFVVAGLDDPGKTLSAQYDFVYIQEATEEGVTFDVYETLLRLMRNNKVPYQQLMMDCNPTTPVHWLYKRSQPGGFLRRYTSTHKDNPAYFDRAANDWTDAGRAYLATLQRMTGARLARFFHGKWQAAEGLVYDGYDPAIHLKPVGWRPPRDWRRVWSIDWGYTAPLVIAMFAVDPDGRAYHYRELYVTRWRVDRAGKWARDLIDTGEEPRPEAVVCDHDPENKASFEAASGLSLTMADKTDRGEGIQAVQARFDVEGDDRPRIYFVEDARRHDPDPELNAAGLPTCLLEELAGYVWKPDAEKDEPIEKNDHACFVAGTLIETDAGPVPIESVQPGSRVLTRRGYCDVITAGMTSHNAIVYDVTFTDGTVLTVTGNHPIWVHNHGYMRVDAVRYNMRVSTLCENPTWTLSNWKAHHALSGSDSWASFTGGIRWQSSRPIGTTFEPGVAMCTRGEVTFTATCGSPSTAPFQTATRSIIGTAIRSTTMSQICNCSRSTSIGRSPIPAGVNQRSAGGMLCHPSDDRRCGMPLPNGTGRTRGASGTDTTGGMSLLPCPTLIGLATAAGQSIASKRMFRSGGSSVRTNAGPLPEGIPESTTKTGRVGGAAGCLALTDIPSNNIALASAGGPFLHLGSVTTAASRSLALRKKFGSSAPCRVHTLIARDDRRPVYNLTVDGNPEYYANGVLVHNCDALRYACRYIDNNLNYAGYYSTATADPLRRLPPGTFARKHR